MINTPPPTVPGVTPQTPAPLPTTAIAVDVAQVTARLQATLDGLKQAATLQVIRAEADLAKQLLTLTTPQGAATIKLPPLDASSNITLPSGQKIPLQQLLTQLASVPPAALKDVYLHIEKPAPALASGQLPPIKLLLTPTDILTQPLRSAATPPPPLQSTQTIAALQAGPLRTVLTPLPEGAIRDLGLLNIVRTPTGAPTNLQPQTLQTAPLAATLNAVKGKVSSLIAKLSGNEINTLGRQGQPTAQPATMTGLPAISTSAATSAARGIATLPFNPNGLVEVLATPAANTVAATVLGATPKGEAIVRLDNGQIFSLAGLRPQGSGSMVYLRNAAAMQASPGAAMGAGEPETLDRLLQEITRILNVVDPALAARVAQQLQPSPGPQMGSALLLLFSVFAGGAFNNKATQRSITLDEAVAKALPEGAATRLLAMLNDDPVKLTRLVPDQVGMEWRGYQIPTPNLPGFTGPVWFYVQQHPHDPQQNNNGGTGSEAKQTRFVIDLDLSRLGHTQLEGIAAHQRLDIKINTGSRMPDDALKTLRDTYTNALSGYGLAGGITFTTDDPIDLDGPTQPMRVTS